MGGKTVFKIYFSPPCNTLKIFWKKKKPGVVQFQDSIRGSVSLAGRAENATSILGEIRIALVKLFNTVTRKKTECM